MGQYIMFETSDACVSPSELLKKAKEADVRFQPLFTQFNNSFISKEEIESAKEERRRQFTDLAALTKVPPEAHLKDTNLLDKQPFVKELNKTVDVGLKFKVNGFENIAKRQIAISEGKFNKVVRHRKRLARIEHKNQIQYRSTHRDMLSEREQRYWWNIALGSYFRENKYKARVIYRRNDCRSFRSAAYLMNCISAIIPNNLTIQYFAEYQQISRWKYCSNPRQQLETLPMRWSGKEVNFLEPFVLRYTLDMSGRKIGYEGLCPYCSVRREDRYDGYEKLFFNIRSCSYEAHIAQKHGVYGSGEELSPPVFVQKENKMKFVCMQCQRMNNMVSDPLDRNDNCLLEYFRHCVNCHYRRRKADSVETQILGQ